MGRGFTFNDAEDRNAIVQDVTIRSGLEENGGGILCDVLASPTILRCRFEQNSATYRGGAASIAPEASPKFVDCEFIQNISLDHGGAVNTGYTSSPEFYGCTFEANRGDRGGAASFGGEALLDGCTFSDNEATVGGGAIGVYGSGDLVTLQNCTVVDNSAGLGGGVYLFYGSISLVNTLICFSTEGEAVYNAAHGSALASCCNVFGNAGGDWVGALEGQLGENANIAEPPFLCDTGSADYHLMPWSPCVPDNNSCGQLIGAVSLGCNCVIRGDINHDGNPTVDISDLVYLVDFMFTSGDALPCIDESDVNADGATDIADLVYVVDFMFNSGPAPVPCP
jgi:predicted outer membrane repeat protein